MTYEDFKDLSRRTVLDNVLSDKGFNVAKNSNCDGYQRRLTSMVYKFYHKKTFNLNKGTRINFESKQLAKELQKPNIKKIDKGKIHSSFIDNIWGVDLAEMQLLSKFKKIICFILCAIDIFSKYTWLVSL